MRPEVFVLSKLAIEFPINQTGASTSEWPHLPDIGGTFFWIKI